MAPGLRPFLSEPYEPMLSTGTSFVEFRKALLRTDGLRVRVLDKRKVGITYNDFAASAYMSYDEAEALRDWLSEWLVDNWPQEEDDETTAD